MERSERGSIVFLALVASIGLLRSAFAGVEYTLTIIDPGVARSINDSGEFTGSVGTGSQDAFIDRNGVLTNFGLQAGDDTQGFGINASGVVAGTADASSILSRAFVRHADGSISFPPLLSAFAISDTGVIAGSAANGSVVNAATYDGTTVTDLPTLGGNSGIAFGINDAGLVVGRARDSAGVDHAVFWRNGSITTLSPKASLAEGVNSSGQIVGSNYFSGVGSDSIMHATLWQNGAATDLTPNELIGSSAAHAVNDAGVIVGYDGFATIWRNGVEQNLNDLIPANSGLTLYNALGINNLGQIVGQGRNSANVDEAFLLTPVPEPAITLTVTALVAALGTRVRGRVRPSF